MHFFNPPQVIRTVEMVHGSETSGRAVATVFKVTIEMQKAPVLVSSCPGFFFNRLLFAYLTQAQRLLYDFGYLPQKVDSVILNAGFLIGPITLVDMNGLDVGWRVKRQNGWLLSALEQELERRKRYGRKTRKGYYQYDEKAKKWPDHEVEVLIQNFASKANRNYVFHSDSDLLEYLLFPLVNEAFNCLDQDIIANLAQGDTMFALGFGWPQSSGGPFLWSQQQGFKRIVERLHFWGSFEPDNMVFRVADGLLAAAAEKSHI